MSTWSEHEEDLLVENLELGYGLGTIAAVLDRTAFDILRKLIELVERGELIVMSPKTFDALVDGGSR
ncbi:MAG: hypothetical protein ACPHJD_05255 [Poseidonia sp.]|jgi:hypothetical protein